jgi:RNA polymerase sigma-70 factor (ECF subfamily)
VPDDELARRWQYGDQAAAGSLIDRHLPRLRAFFATRCGSATEADDLTQEVFLAVCRHIATYRSEQVFSGWLYRIARNKAADYWRRLRPTEHFEESHAGLDERTPARIYEDGERGARAWKTVFARLPEAQASALWLRVQEELSVDEVACALGVTLANAKVLLFRARQTMAAHWKTRAVTL